MSTVRFVSTIEIHGVNPYVLVSAKRASQIKSGWRKPMPVFTRVNGQPEKPWAINMMPVGDGSFRLYLHGVVRKASGTRVGDRVKVEISFDNAYKSGPAHPVPSWFRTALSRNAIARGNWELLIPSRKKEVLRYFASLKSAQARKRNLTRALEVLSGKPERFMGRLWTDGK